MEKHDAKWCEQNPQQTAGDIWTLKLAIANVKKLIEGGEPHQMAEAKDWLNNASKI
jgi:hypothetical protein